MVGGGPSAPPLLQPPQVMLPVSPVQLPVHAARPIVSPTQPFHPDPMPQLNWSHLSQNSQVNQMKMQKHIFLGQMIGWTHMLS